MYKQYIFLGFIISTVYFPCKSMEKYILSKPQSIKKRKRSDLLWQAQYITPNNQLYATLKLPLHIYNQKKDICKKPNQQKFLKKFKNIELPYVLNEKEKAIFDSLQCNFLFIIKTTDEGWEIEAAPSLPAKLIDIDSMWK